MKLCTKTITEIKAEGCWSLRVGVGAGESVGRRKHFRPMGGDGGMRRQGSRSFLRLWCAVPYGSMATRTPFVPPYSACLVSHAVGCGPEGGVTPSVRLSHLGSASALHGGPAPLSIAGMTVWHDVPWRFKRHWYLLIGWCSRRLSGLAAVWAVERPCSQ